MSAVTFSDLPPELVYTILSHALAQILFHHLFVGALVPNGDDDDDDNDPSTTPSTAAAAGLGCGLDEISSFASVSIAWRATVQRILAALLQRPNRDKVQSPITRRMLHRAHRHLTPKAHPIDVSTSTNTACPITHCLSVLRTMQTTLRGLVQHSIDTYRSEQDAMSIPNQTGITTPTLLPVPVIPHPPHPITVTVATGTPPSIPPTSVSVPVSNPPITHTPTHANGNGNGNGNVNVNDCLFGPLLLIAAPTLGEYTTTPLFQNALCYSQAAIFTCESSNSFASSLPATTNRGMRASLFGAGGGAVRVQRPDVSTLVLTTSRLVAALEWVGTTSGDGTGRMRVCPREVADVADCGMREVRERIEDAIQVCRWNDLLDAVFLRGERSEEMLEALDGCFDELEVNVGSIQMHHLLRSNLFKTVQTVARLGPINTPAPAHLNTLMHSGNMNTPSHSNPHTPSHSNPHTPSHCGEVWRSRAGALAFRWMGRVVEWTGL